MVGVQHYDYSTAFLNECLYAIQDFPKVTVLIEIPNHKPRGPHTVPVSFKKEHEAFCFFLYNLTALACGASVALFAVKMTASMRTKIV
jgi:hypothetical protein